MTESFWVVSGPGIPCGARELGSELLGPAPEGTVWLDVCVIGSHLPQMYRVGEVSGLAPEECPQLGLCAHCLGFGDMEGSTLLDALARGVNETGGSCPECGGSGRPAVRVSVQRSSSGITGEISLRPHAYVSPRPQDGELRATFGVPADMCLACGTSDSSRLPSGGALHVGPEG
jgi:hypothetical protein